MIQVMNGNHSNSKNIKSTIDFRHELDGFLPSFQK